MRDYIISASMNSSLSLIDFFSSERLLSRAQNGKPLNLKDKAFMTVKGFVRHS